MDYDDNDFQSQNLHLAGEGSTKFPPALRPYALPKFDFDESLQGNLRFDSLVETEVFLGIESNEDNQWIDAFSRGGSGIEFSSTAAESCTISRHGNVWSEATSSESVEMLLKSVGQEEFIPRQTAIQESDACDELACIAKQMDSNPKPDDKNEFKDVITDLQPPVGIHGNLPGLKRDVGMKPSLAGVSQSHEGGLSTDGSSANPELNDVCRDIDLPVSEGNPRIITDTKGINTNQTEVETVADDLHGEKTQDDSSVSGFQADVPEASIRNMGDEKGVLQTPSNKQDLESSMTRNEAVVDTQTLDGNAVGGDTYHPDKSLCSISTTEALEGGNVVEGLEMGVNSLEDSLGMESSSVSELQKGERYSENVCSSDLPRNSTSEDVVALKDEVMDDQSVLNTHELPKASKEDSISKGRGVEVTGFDHGICPNLQQNVDVVENTVYGESSVGKENKLLNTGDHMDMVILSSKPEISVLTARGNNTSKVSEGILGESAQICQINEPDRQTDQKFDQDASVNDHESKRITSDSSQIHSDVDQSQLTDKGVSSSSLGAGSAETEMTTFKVSINVTPIKNSASQVVSEDITSTSCEVTDMPPPSNQVVSTHEVAGHNDFQGVTLVGPSVDGKEESAAKVAVEAGISVPVGSSEEDPAPCPIPGTEKHRSCDTSRQLPCETVSDRLHDVEGTSDTVNTSELQGAIDDKVIRGCTKEIGVPPVLHESMDKQGDSVTIVTKAIKDDQDNLQDNCDKSSSGDDILPGNKAVLSSAPLPDTHVELPKTGSFPANTTCSPLNTSRSPSQTEKDENQVKASADQNPPVSEFTKIDTKNTLSTAHDLKGNNASKDDRSLTVEVNPVADLSTKDVTDVNQEDFHKTQPVLVPVTAANKTSTAVDRSPLTSGLGPSTIKIAGNISHGSPQILDREVAHSVPKATPERKPRRASSKTPRKESSRKGRKDAALARQYEGGGKSTNVSLSQSPAFQLMQSNEVQKYGHIDPNSTKPFALVNASVSSLPDLNTSASPVLFHQPFTDVQQVQLRAQIFVYGALIQGTAPDEAYMISAFGGPDGGRSIWENAWCGCMERLLGQKSHPVNPETPLQSRSGSRASDSAVKQSAVQGKGISSSLGQASSKATTTIVNPLVPLSSPLWNLPTPSGDSLQTSALARGSVVDYSQAHTTLHPYQTPPLRNFLGHNTSWIPPASLRGPWFASPSPATDNIAHLSASPVSDTMKFSSTKGSSLPPSSGLKNVTPGLPASGASSPNIIIGTASPLDANNVIVSPAQHSSDPKPKKRKKATVSEDLGQKTLQSLPAAVTSVAIATPVAIAPVSAGERSVVSVSPLADHLKSDQNMEKRILSDESLMKVKEARLHAEEASAFSAAAVNHSQEIWTQLDKHKNSGLMPDIEAKLASAAVAVAAAAAVAKAAAAAANVASNAALQAKLMADEALISSGYENSSQISLSEGTSNFGKASPASILKGANGTNSSGSIIVAAKEAVRRRVEAASAATKRAENMDAIVKAAELAAEAVSQAGKIVTMGDPLPLSDLVEAGPEGCFKATEESTQQVGLLKGMTRDLMNIDNIRDNAETSNPLNRDISSGDNPTSINEKNSRGRRKGSDLIKPVDVVPESEPQIQASFTVTNGTETLDGNNIKEGSLVEVFKDEEGFKAAWFPANILSVKDGKAYVCYNSLVAVEGAGPLKEWVALVGEGDKPPRIRTARPLTSLHYEGTRKRRRAAMGDYAWSVGDKVDAWIQESWWEGVITEKNKKDETTFTVHFPVSGETTVVRAWHLRPSLIWKDGKWTESSKAVATGSAIREGDTPHEKRPKLGNPAVELQGKEKMLKSIDTVESSNPDELRLLNLTDNEKVFNIGNNSKNENKPDTHTMVRTGIQEGSKVIFGVPKPGKKRKFMEVSKHYVGQGSSKTSDRNDSVKLSNFLMPQGSGTRGWKSSSKNDTKERVGADSKPKTFKSGKPQTAFGRAIPPKDSASSASSLTSDPAGHKERIKDSSHFKNATQSESHVERAPSASDGATEGPILFSTDAPKKTSTSRASKGKLAPAGGKLGKGGMEKPSNDNPIKSTSDVIEPRRSNRRIQPTSRLLEGLQSSLIISKIPSVSHNRNASKGNN